MTTDTAQFDLHRKIAATPDRLWHLLTDPQSRGLWNAPDDDMQMTPLTEDVRVGGVERHRCGPEDAPMFEADTRWYRLEAPRDAAFTETILIGGDAIATSLVTYRVSPISDGCELHVTVAISSFCGPDAAGEFQTGWTNALNKLAAYAQTPAS